MYICSLKYFAYVPFLVILIALAHYPNELAHNERSKLPKECPLLEPTLNRKVIKSYEIK